MATFKIKELNGTITDREPTAGKWYAACIVRRHSDSTTWEDCGSLGVYLSGVFDDEGFDVSDEMADADYLIEQR